MGKISYQLVGRNSIDNVQECFLENRGVKDAHKYLNLNESVVNDYDDLDNIEEAVDLYLTHIVKNPAEHIAILVDCDADGFTSAAMIYRYTRMINNSTKITYLLHSGKQHGLSNDITVPEDIELLIIPDAGSSDIGQCKVLKDKGIDILILDHHKADVKNPYAVVVNNQLSPNYENKELCGAGVVYQFLRAVDNVEWYDYADTLLDLCAIGNIADVMDMRSYETRYLVGKGLEQIVNDGLQALFDKKSFDMGGRINIHGTEWNITPLINSVCRFGTQEDKEVLFKAFIGDNSETYECRVKNPETGKFEKAQEDVYAHAARLAMNAKARQTKAVKTLMPILTDWVELYKADEHNIVFVRLPDDAEPELSGLVAIRLANKYHKPVLILKKNEREGDYYFTGSGRNFDNSPLDSLRDLLIETGCFNYVAGHDNAFGFEIENNKVKDAIKACDELTKDIDFTQVKCDFSLSGSDLDLKFIRDVDNLQDLLGAGLKEPIVHLYDVELYASQGEIIGKDGTTWRFNTEDDITFIKFLNKSDDTILVELDKYLQNEDGADDPSETKFVLSDVICTVGINQFNSIYTPQVQIIDYEIGVIEDEY